MTEIYDEPRPCPHTDGCLITRRAHEPEQCAAEGKWCGHKYKDGSGCLFRQANHEPGGPRPWLRHKFVPVEGSDV